MSLRSMAKRLHVLLFSVALGGCQSFPVPVHQLGSSAPPSEWSTLQELSILKALYDYSDRLDQLSADDRSREFERIQSGPEAARSPLERIQLGLILSADEPGLEDYPRARSEFRAAYLQVASEPLLSGFVRSRLSYLDRLELMDMALARADRKQRQLLASRNDTRPAKQTAASPVPEQDPSPAAPDSEDKELQEAVRLGNMEWRLQAQQLQGELNTTQDKLKERESVISEQDKQIEVLEAKIKALSAIELNLNQRDLNEREPDPPDQKQQAPEQ